MLYPAELPGPLDASAGKKTRTGSKMTAGDKPDIDASLDASSP